MLETIILGKNPEIILEVLSEELRKALLMRENSYKMLLLLLFLVIFLGYKSIFSVYMISSSLMFHLYVF